MSAIALLAGGVGTGIAVGGAFGARHAFEADHVAAVAALVDDAGRPSVTGLSWGAGHSVPVVLIGVLFIALDLRLPASVATGAEYLVAALLVVLGVRVLAGRDSLGRLAHRRLPWDDGSAAQRHRHVTLRGRAIGLTHSHAAGDSFAVGVVHGLAGSGGVVVALAAAAPTPLRGAAFLAGFALTSAAAMAVAAAIWGRLRTRGRWLRVVAGIGSVAVGLLLFATLLDLPTPL